MKRPRTEAVGLILALAFVLVGQAASVDQAASAQSSYQRGQNISPAYEGWEKDADGSRYFLFGYMNHNWLEELDVPVGQDNLIEPGKPDQGQPTHFQPRRNRVSQASHLRSRLAR